MAKNDYLQVWDKKVVKANELIQKSRFNLSLQQQKIVLYLISQISMYDDEFKLYEFSVVDFCNACGVDYRNGKCYQEIKLAIKEIADKSLWIKINEDEETLLRWIEKPYINNNSGMIKIRLDEDMKPYLLKLKENFTQYELIWTLHFKSKYTIRLYELIKSIHYHEREEYEREYDIEELKRILGAENYKTYQSFKSRVLIPSITEINSYSDKNLEYIPIKNGRAVKIIKLIISSKSSLEMLRIRSDIEKELGSNQITLWELMAKDGLLNGENENE